MTRVLVTYGWVRSSYAVLRNLTAHGVKVFVADSFRTGMCQASRKKAGFDIYPSHYHDEEGFVAAMVEICARRRIDLIMASHNETEVLARHRNQFPGTLGALLPDPASIAAFNNKSKAFDLAVATGIPVPKRLTYRDVDELAEGLRRTGMERAVVKLLTGNSSKGVFHAASADETLAMVRRLIIEFKLPQERYPQVEEYVEGEGWGSSALFWQGKKIAGFTHRRLREKIVTGGTSTLREARRNPDLEAATERILSHVGWHGFAMVEFKVCPHTGQFWFIEVNPRLWGSLPLAVAAGVEFPYLGHLCVTEGPEAAKAYAEAHPPSEGWRNRWLLGELTVAAKQALRLKLSEAAQTLFSSHANGYDDIFLNDPTVFPGEVLRYVLSAVANGSQEGMVG